MPTGVINIPLEYENNNLVEMFTEGAKQQVRKMNMTIKTLTHMINLPHII